MKLHPRQATKLAHAHLEHLAAKRAAERAKEKRDELLKEYTDRLPVGEWLELAGFRLRRRTVPTGEGFSLKGYREAGHKVTAAMRKFISSPSTYDQLDVESLEQ